MRNLGEGTAAEIPDPLHPSLSSHRRGAVAAVGVASVEAVGGHHGGRGNSETAAVDPVGPVHPRGKGVGGSDAGETRGTAGKGTQNPRAGVVEEGHYPPSPLLPVGA